MDLQSPVPAALRLRPLRPGGDAPVRAEHAPGGGLRGPWSDHAGSPPRRLGTPLEPTPPRPAARLARRRRRGHAHPAQGAGGRAAAGLRAMKRFADLYEALDSTTSTLAKVAAMRRYFHEAPAADAAWALWFLTGRRPKRLLGVRALVAWTLELTGTPDWLFGECYAVVGDLAECIALLLDDGTRVTRPDETALSEWMEQRILPLRGLDADEQRARVTGWWRALDRRELFLL